MNTLRRRLVRRKRLRTVGVAAYLLILGVLLGMIVDRVLYDRQRSELLGRYEQSLRDWQAYRMDLGKESAGRR